MPMPLSITSTLICESSTNALTVTFPPSGVNLSAFPRMLLKIRLILVSSPIIVGRKSEIFAASSIFFPSACNFSASTVFSRTVLIDIGVLERGIDLPTSSREMSRMLSISVCR